VREEQQERVRVREREREWPPGARERLRAAELLAQQPGARRASVLARQPGAQPASVPALQQGEPAALVARLQRRERELPRKRRPRLFATIENHDVCFGSSAAHHIGLFVTNS
jgi:hypothetical protein